MNERFDAIVIGAGQAGTPLAIDFARAGRKTALVERAHVGGTCVNVGCTPTKTMVASARVAYLARRGADYGVRHAGVTIDQPRVRERKRAIVESFRGGGRKRVEGTENLTLVTGEARFTGPRAIEVRGADGSVRALGADTIVINAGCRPARPALTGIDAVAWLDSTTVMELEVVPRHLVVLGGGYIGLEFGQMFRRFGSAVTIVQRGSHLLAREDDDVADEVATILRDDGIDVLLDAEATDVAGTEDGSIAVTVRTREGPRVIHGSHLLVAAGRVPNTEGLDLTRAGVEVDRRGFVRVDERLAATASGIYAAGDVVGGPAFTHISYDDYRILRDNLIHGGKATNRARLAPWTVFIDPEVAHVGLREREAAAAGRRFRVAKMPMSHVARALEMDESRGFMKALVDPDSKLILGFTVIGISGGELMSVVQMAMMGGVTYPTVREAIFVHPTLAESLNNLFALLGD